MDTVTKIKNLMEEYGTNKMNLEKSCGLANGIILKWEKGIQNPSSDAIVEIAKHFKVSTDYLLGLTDEKTKYNAKSINNSAVAQGHNSSAINGKTELSKEEEDIIKIYRSFDFKKRLEFLNKLSEIKE